MTRRPRLNDIAQLAGVSQATVSLVLNGVANARIAAATRARVQAVAAELGYARRSAVGRGGVPVIGLLIDEVVTTPFAAPFLDGARQQAADAGALVLACCTGGDPATEAAAIESLRGLRLAGVLYTSLVTRVVAVPQALAGLPVVMVNAQAPRGSDGAPCCSVVPADLAGGHAATQALIAAGHRRIGHIAGEEWGMAARDRAQGYRRALASADLPPDPALVAGPAWTAISGRAAAHRLLDLPDPPTAIFCFNDRVALGVYEAAAERGLRIPHDLSVIGFDNDEIAATLQPPLTTMVLPHEDMARWAVDRLMQGQGLAPLRIKIPCDMVVRASVAPPHV